MRVVLGRYNTSVDVGDDQVRKMIVGDKERFRELIDKASSNGAIFAEYGNPVMDIDSLSSHDALKRNLEINTQNIFCVISNIEIEEVEQTNKNIKFPILVVTGEIDIDELPFEPSFGIRSLATKETIEGETYDIIEHIISWDLRTDICQTTKKFVGPATTFWVNRFNLLPYKFKIALTEISDSDLENLEKLLLVIKELTADEDPVDGIEDLIADIENEISELKNNG